MRDEHAAPKCPLQSSHSNEYNFRQLYWKQFSDLSMSLRRHLIDSHDDSIRHNCYTTSSSSIFLSPSPSSSLPGLSHTYNSLTPSIHHSLTSVSFLFTPLYFLLRHPSHIPGFLRLKHLFRHEPYCKYDEGMSCKRDG